MNSLPFSASAEFSLLLLRASQQLSHQMLSWLTVKKLAITKIQEANDMTAVLKSCCEINFCCAIFFHRLLPILRQ